MSRLFTLALALPLALSSVACNDSSSSEPAQEGVVTQSITSNSPEPSEAPATAAVASAEFEELVRTIAPQKARNGSLRFSDAELVKPAAAPLLLARLQGAGESEAVKNALIMALPQTQGEYAAEAVELLRTERSEVLRASLVDAMRLAGDSEAAHAGLSLGMNDSSDAVRVRAAFAIGRRADGLALADALVRALADDNTELQATAARALGNLKAADAFDALAPLVKSRDAQVRLESLRALGRIDADRAADLPELSKLSVDSDDRIRTAAGKVAAKAY